MLCLVEKTLIARSDRRVSLNRRTEIMSKCRHRMPYYLINYHGLHVPPDPDPLPPNQHDLLPEEPDPLPTPQQPGPVPAHPDHQHGADPLPTPLPDHPDQQDGASHSISCLPSGPMTRSKATKKSLNS